MTNYPWYEIVSDEIILQGDLFENIPFEYSRNIVNKKKATAVIDYYDVIVLSQSCDLVARKLKNVILCPYWTLEEFGQANNTYQSKKGKKN
ncbi:MAG: hypothetical protein GF308_16625 [Candidatus Heimdallarchaeota archaeon]|nr:hypothetical protein [Candidatus Heimdallarchaeota archaeon]